MKQYVIGSLTAALVMSSLGVALPSNAQQADESEQPPQVNAYASNPAPVSTSEALLTKLETSVDIPATLSDTQSIVRVYPHPLDNRQAVTVYVRDIPVLTLLGGDLVGSGYAPTPVTATLEAANLSDLSEASEVPISQDPIVRATAIAARINELSRSGFDATTIRVRWDDSQRKYVIVTDDSDLVAIDDQTILPDTTDQAAEDALQVANRLRRLLGDAPPIREIEGQSQASQPAVTGEVLYSLTGTASWYGPGFNGRRSASGEIFNQNALTAAHRTLPFGTLVRVTNLRTNQQVVVRINDRGPYSHGRIIDLSAGAARAVGLMSMGTGPVRLEVLSTP